MHVHVYMWICCSFSVIEMNELKHKNEEEVKRVSSLQTERTELIAKVGIMLSVYLFICLLID